MSGRKAFGALAITTALLVLGVAAAAGSERDRGDREHGGAVKPCSLDGVNPAYHPEVFSNAAAAAAYGFVQGPDRVWRVRANCRPY
jgi:hypothetical protein